MRILISIYVLTAVDAANQDPGTDRYVRNFDLISALVNPKVGDGTDLVFLYNLIYFGIIIV